jgi:hypothetical protein
MAEDCGAVEGAVVLRVVQPAFGVMGVLTPQSKANDMRGAATAHKPASQTLVWLQMEGTSHSEGEPFLSL